MCCGYQRESASDVELKLHAEIRLYSPNRTTRIRRRRTGRPRELKNDVYTNTNCENDSSIRPTICRVIARPSMPPAFHLLPRLLSPVRPVAEKDARAFGHRLNCTAQAPDKPQLQNFSRTQEVHPLWVREIVWSRTLRTPQAGTPLQKTNAGALIQSALPMLYPSLE